MQNPPDIPKKKKVMSTMEILLIAAFVGSLILSFLQAWKDEHHR